MKPLKYIISNYGFGIVIGLVGDKQLAEQDAVLAENIYGCHHSDNLFSGLVHMSDLKQFKKFLVLKEYFQIWSEHNARNKVSGRRDPANIMQFTRRAIKRAKLVLDSQVSHENFMANIGSRNMEYDLGTL